MLNTFSDEPVVTERTLLSKVIFIKSAAALLCIFSVAAGVGDSIIFIYPGNL